MLVKMTEAKEIISALVWFLIFFVILPVLIIYYSQDCKTAIAIAYFGILLVLLNVSWDIYKAVRK